jgi:hypothetical protein
VKKARLLGHHLEKNRTKRRPHRKTHGTIGFTTLSSSERVGKPLKMTRNSITETLLPWTWIGVKSALPSIIMGVYNLFGDILFGIFFPFAMNVDAWHGGIILAGSESPFTFHSPYNEQIDLLFINYLLLLNDDNGQ